jgi:nucleoside-diphosphate-sugar epimerase
MRIFVAGATGAIGRRLVPMLLEAGHEVTGMTRSARKAEELRALGAGAVVADALDRQAVVAAVREARAECVVHQLTAIGELNLRNPDKTFGATNRLRTEGTDNLLAAARAAGARRFVAQSFAGWPFAREGGAVKDEDAPLDPSPPEGLRETHAAIRHLEQAVLAADGGGVWSLVHIDDAASATVAAIERGAPGIYNVVDDEPAPVREWLPVLAEAIGGKPPRRVPRVLARLLMSPAALAMMTEIRGASNAKARRELGWRPAHPTWREGFSTL